MSIDTGNFDNPFNPGYEIPIPRITQGFNSNHFAIDLVPFYPVQKISSFPYIYACIPGRITVIPNTGNCGNGVKIENTDSKGNKYELIHCHLKTVMVNNGQYVNYGDCLGIMGSTGRSTGRHLHWDLQINDQHIDISKTNMSDWKNIRRALGADGILQNTAFKNALGILFTGLTLYYVSKN